VYILVVVLSLVVKIIGQNRSTDKTNSHRWQSNIDDNEAIQHTKNVNND